MMFSSIQRQSLLNSFVDAGFEKVFVQENSTLLAVSCSQKFEKQEKVLFVSWLDTHLEVSVSMINQKKIDILDKIGSFHLGAFEVRRTITKVLTSNYLKDTINTRIIPCTLR